MSPEPYAAHEPHQHAPLPRLELAVSLEPPLDVVGQGQVEIIAAQDQVLADRHAVELDLLVRSVTLSQARDLAATDHVSHDDLPGWVRLVAGRGEILRPPAGTQNDRGRDRPEGLSVRSVRSVSTPSWRL